MFIKGFPPVSIHQFSNDLYTNYQKQIIKNDAKSKLKIPDSIHLRFFSHFFVHFSYEQRYDSTKQHTSKSIFHLVELYQCPQHQEVFKNIYLCINKYFALQVHDLKYRYYLLIPSSSLAMLNAWFKFSIFLPGISFEQSNKSGRCEWIRALKPKPVRHDVVKS